ncbi:MAG TPA: SusD/RagB family nutrient-binding outer membrane lipoprotein [Lutibacter sp.]|nr:SusD/RagB family nutrient-binding outer membrane lipoprotein [Lutibacter sp.]
MKTIKLIKSTLLALSVVAMTVSCSDFLDVNDNPNDPSISTPGLTLPVAQTDFAALNARTMTYVGQFFVYNWATPSNWSANQEFPRYNITTTFNTAIFETSYAVIFKNLTYIENYEDATGAVDYSSYKVIAKTIKGFQYQYLVDIYGDIPYTEANLRGANTTPKYDDAETVYKQVIDELTAAADLALNLPGNAENPGSQDVIFGGDMDKWAQFANSVKLRMLVRLSNTGQDAYIKGEIAKINANTAGYITEDVAANPGYSDNAEKQSPFYGYFRNPSTNSQTDRGDYTVATDFTINYLTGTADPRRERLYAPATTGGAYKGVYQSTLLPGTGFTSNDLSKVGPGLLKSHAQDQYIMLLAESKLLQAEAVQRGYIAAGSAETLYNEAIEASFTTLGVPAAVVAAQTYYAQALPNVSWASSPNKLQAISTQKWIALNGTSSIELWVEYTRTGFPVGLPIPAESGGVRPVRLLYPASEIARNSANVPTLTNQDAFTKAPFWK